MKNNIDKIKESQAKKAILRDIEYLRPLLLGLKYEPSINFDYIKNLSLDTFYNQGTFIINSNTPLLRHFSVKMLIDYYDKNTTYYIQDGGIYVDAWFSDIFSPLKQNIIKPDILIMDFFNKKEFNVNPHRKVLEEILSTRIASNKKTWIFTSTDSNILEKNIFNQDIYNTTLIIDIKKNNE